MGGDGGDLVTRHGPAGRVEPCDHRGPCAPRQRGSAPTAIPIWRCKSIGFPITKKGPVGHSTTGPFSCSGAISGGRFAGADQRVAGRLTHCPRPCSILSPARSRPRSILSPARSARTAARSPARSLCRPRGRWCSAEFSARASRPRHRPRRSGSLPWHRRRWRRRPAPSGCGLFFAARGQRDRGGTGQGEDQAFFAANTPVSNI
ncbi:unnamed protein product [Acanthosepion pharaonis]|uniref:Uncharacterized protein n=1 Tax=Acanthosepion pharaonis TaxID=158019 RepID=A0A812DF02_ACAPH|nr:unnamed protein product [Sepia pharaonis]